MNVMNVDRLMENSIVVYCGFSLLFIKFHVSIAVNSSVLHFPSFKCCWRISKFQVRKKYETL